MEALTGMLARVAPRDVIAIVQDQILTIANDENGGLLTFGMLGTIWSMSSGMDAIIDTLNTAYDIQESRRWWKRKVTAIGLTLALAVFIVLSMTLVLVGPSLGARAAEWFGLGAAFTTAWTILQWPVVFVLVTFGIAIVYYYAPDAEQEWIWITPGSVVATVLWIVISLGFKFYVANFTSYNATYGAIGGVIILLLWFYVSSLAVILGAELNAEIEHASPYGKDPGDRKVGERKKIGLLAEREWRERRRTGAFVPAVARANCTVDDELPSGAGIGIASNGRPRASDWLLGGLVVGETALVTLWKLRSRFRRLSS
jgi:membrane protein